jgi:hypothetical protein
MEEKDYSYWTKELEEVADPKCTTLALWFYFKEHIELEKITFRSPLLLDEIRAVRGKTPGAYLRSVTFQWTSAVQALSILLLRAAQRQVCESNSEEPLLQGGKGSPAASLDAALNKDSAWLDLFGGDERGKPMSKQILLRSNSGLRRTGPVTISLNERILPRECISVYLDNKRVQNSRNFQECIEAIERCWRKAHSMDPFTVTNSGRRFCCVQR